MTTQDNVVNQFALLIARGRAFKVETREDSRTSYSFVRMQNKTTTRTMATISEPREFQKWKTEVAQFIEWAFPLRGKTTDTFVIDCLRCAPRGLNELLDRLEGLRAAFNDGYSRTLVVELSAEIGSDLLQEASQLLGSKKEGAALELNTACLYAGIALETHIRTLCRQLGIEATKRNKNGELQKKKMPELIQELKLRGACTEAQKKRYESYVQMRNQSAHGAWEALVASDIAEMIEGVKGFLSRDRISSSPS